MEHGPAPRKYVIVGQGHALKGRIHLGLLAKRAHLDNEYFILEKDGIPVTGMMDADEMEEVVGYYARTRAHGIREVEELTLELLVTGPTLEALRAGDVSVSPAGGDMFTLEKEGFR